MDSTNHSYEEIRGAALDVLAGRERGRYDATQYAHLAEAAAEVFLRRENRPQSIEQRGRPAYLSPADSEMFLEVFWDLFRQGIITLGSNDSNREFPHFRVSRMGRQILANQDTYFFHDVSTYTKLLTHEVPTVDPITLLYVQEALQAFRSGCLLSSSVMLGVATEHTFLLLIEATEQSPTYSAQFSSVSKERTILQKVNKFKNILDQIQKSLPSDIKEDLDTNFAGILSIIRTFRNQSGHPSGKIVDRDQAYILLNLFIPYCKKLYQLKELLRQ